jgi:drug/metabolite transporter (DMT)-like permease
MDLTRHTRGIVTALGAATISGFAVFANGLAVKRFDDATVYTTAKNLLAGVLLLAVAGLGALTAPKAPPARLHGRDRLWLALIAVIGGAVPFVLFFEGLSRATSTNAAFIHKTLVFWVAIGATAVLRERVTFVHAAAIGLLLAGYAVLAGGGPETFGAGELMILAATLLWAIEVVVVRSILPGVPVRVAAASRMAGGSLVLLAWVTIRGDLGDLVSLGASQWLWLLLTGTTLAMFVGTWYAALAAAPAVDVTAVLVLGAVLTGLLDTGFRGVPLTTASYGYVLLVVAVAAVVALHLRPASRVSA